MSVLSTMKGVQARDQQMIREAETMFGPEPDSMGFIKNLFWGRVREDLVFPYPEVSAAETAKTEALLAELNHYLIHEHPSVEIDQEQYVPDWAIRRLFDMGVMGMTVPEQYGGLGLSVASYNRVLEAIGRRCGSTAVIVSAHQSIGCKALMLFGSDEQKARFLPKVAREYLSGFCLSEPQVGSDAAGQQTSCTVDPATGDYILNGEKKWITSGALSGLLTVMTNQMVVDPKTGKEKKGVTALMVTPDMPGVTFFQKNRSKTGIRGTWQARIRFENVRVPKEMLLHTEGQGLKVALTCLNYGRCTLSAGVSGAAKQAAEQATKWVQTRHQFNRPLADFELVQQRVALMHATVFAMDAMLYMTCGMLDRHDADIMVETAACKYFCSEEGWVVIDNAMQVMGGEGYVTENEFDRLWRDNRIHRIVEGSNEVMQAFIFAYGGKQLAEHMLGVLNTVQWDDEQSFQDNVSRILGGTFTAKTVKAGTPLAAEIFLGKKVPAPALTRVHPSLRSFADRLANHVRTHTREFKLASKRMEEAIVTAQATQARLADSATQMFAWSCVLSKLDQMIANGVSGAEWEHAKASGLHFMDLAHERITRNVRELNRNPDASMRRAAAAAYAYMDQKPDADYYVHESSPTHTGKGHAVATAFIKQFPETGEPFVPTTAVSGDGARTDVRAPSPA